MEILKVENLTKTYGSGENLVHAVDDVSFSVEKGEFVAIVGASGSGKSTLLHLIGGVDRPTSGKIFYIHLIIPPTSDFTTSFLIQILPYFLISVHPLYPGDRKTLLSLLRWQIFHHNTS